MGFYFVPSAISREAQASGFGRTARGCAYLLNVLCNRTRLKRPAPPLFLVSAAAYIS